MHSRSWRAALVVAGVMSIAPSIAAQVQGGHAATTAFVAVSFTGEHMGRFPAANCMSDRTKGLLYLTDFVETTPTNAPAGFGSFDVQLSAACITPYFRALFAREPMSVVITFLAENFEPTLSFSLTHAQLAHARISILPGGVGNSTPLLQLSIVAPEVTVTSGGAPAVASTTTPATSPTRLSRERKMTSVPPRRMPAPPFSLPASRKIMIASAAPSGNGSSWIAHGMSTMATLHLAAATLPPVDLQVSSSGLRIDAGYATDAASQMPTGPMQIVLGPLVGYADANSASLKNAATAHVPLTQAVLTCRDYGGRPAITFTMHGARLASDQIAAPSASQTAISETLQLGLEGLTITDIGSGKTAQSNP